MGLFSKRDETSRIIEPTNRGMHTYYTTATHCNTLQHTATRRFESHHTHKGVTAPYSQIIEPINRGTLTNHSCRTYESI